MYIKSIYKKRVRVAIFFLKSILKSNIEARKGKQKRDEQRSNID